MGVNVVHPHKINNNIGFALGTHANYFNIISYYLTGKYRCAGFLYDGNQIMCIEEAGKYFGGYPKSGSYCHDVLGLDLYEDVGDRLYK